MASKKKHPNWKIRTKSSTPKQEARRFQQLAMQVEDIAFHLMVSAALVVVMGILTSLITCFVLFSLFKLILQNPNGDYGDFALVAFFTILGLFVLSSGIFIIKVAADFRKFKSWTYGWVEFFSKYTSLSLFIKKDAFNQDLRRAFNQPEYEYPDLPEYGYKLEDNQNSKK